MTKPRDVRWKLEPQTAGKHRVLRAYLDAWLPILGSRPRPILFIDGFAGPGRYEGGEDGSPIIALKAFRDHASAPRIAGPVVFVFIELDEDRHAALEAEVAALAPPMPSKAEIHIECDRFETNVSVALDRIEADGKVLVPTLCMADPFGADGIPLKLFSRILVNPSSELFITVMASFVRRFGAEPGFERVLNDLYGDESWRPLVAIPDSAARQRALLDRYEQRLRDAGADFVLRFDLYDGGTFVYSIFFATNDLLGCERMKDAIWKVMPDGNFEYRDRDQAQLTFGISAPQMTTMESQIERLLQGEGPMSMAQLREWAQSDRTMFRKSKHLLAAVRALESAGRITADRSGGKAFTDPVVLAAPA